MRVTCVPGILGLDAEPDSSAGANQEVLQQQLHENDGSNADLDASSDADIDEKGD